MLRPILPILAAKLHPTQSRLKAGPDLALLQQILAARLLARRAPRLDLPLGGGDFLERGEDLALRDVVGVDVHERVRRLVRVCEDGGHGAADGPEVREVHLCGGVVVDDRFVRLEVEAQEALFEAPVKEKNVSAWSFGDLTLGLGRGMI